MHPYLSHEKLQARQLYVSKYPIVKADNPVLPCCASLKSAVQEVYNQGAEGSCTANAYCAAYRILETDKSFLPSRAYVYWHERLQEDGNDPTKVTDSGANVADGINWVTENGVCSETLWPYGVQMNIPPPLVCEENAKGHKLGKLNQIKVGDNQTIKQCLATGIPVMIAIALYKSFEQSFMSRFGVIPMPAFIQNPNDTTDTYSGGHEVMLTGYHDFPGYFTFLNSWGSDWGNKGYGYLPYAYVSNTDLTWSIYFLSK
jgi:C1A family cysteine protease